MLTAEQEQQVRQIAAGQISDYLRKPLWSTIGPDDGAVPVWNASKNRWELNVLSGVVPLNAEFVVVSLNGSLTNERRLQATTPITLTDGGAGGDLTIAHDTHTAAQIQHNLLTGTSGHHADTNSQSPVRGSMIIAEGATPRWGDLPFSSGMYLRSGADEPDWSPIEQLDTPGGGPFFGWAHAETGTANLAADTKYAVGPWLLLADMTVKSLWIDVWRNTSNGTAKAVIYQDSSGSPGTLIGTSDEVTISNSASSGFPFIEFPFSTKPALAAGTKYHLGLISNSANLRIGSRTTNQYVNGLGVQFFSNADTYAGGASDPFGAATGTTRILGVYAEPDVAAGSHTHSHDTDLTGVSANDHHNEDHKARHATGGADLLYSIHHYVFAPDVAPGDDIVAGDQQGSVFHSGPADEIVQRIYTDFEAAPGTNVVVTLQYASGDTLDSSPTWTEIDAITHASGDGMSLVTTSGFTNGTIPSRRVLRMNITSISGTAPKTGTIILEVKRPLAT